jgi:hypothetical protein
VSARIIVFLLACAIPGAGYAQTADARPVRRLEVDAGGGLLGGAGLGSTDANLRANAQTRQPFRLFTAESRFVRAPEFHVRTGYALTRRFGIEGGVTFSHPDIRSSITADAEGAAAITTVERIDQYFFDASVVVMLDALRVGRLVPFAAAGGGYLRQLHEGQTVIEEGQVYHAGGGVKYFLLARTRGLVRATGVRSDARVHVLRDGIAFEDRPRPHVALSGSLFVAF